MTDDIEAYERAKRQTGPALSSEAVQRIIEGEHPLKPYRQACGMTQAALAEASGVNRVQIADIEAGRRKGSVATLRKLADALGLTLDDLA